MKTCTTTVTLTADRDAVYSFLAEIRNLPRWAPALVRRLRQEGHHWRALTPGGEDYVAVVPDARTGVLDLFVGQRPDEMAPVPLRVIRQGGGAAVICSYFLPAGWSEEVGERYHNALVAGLRGLGARFGGGEVAAPQPGPNGFYPSVVTARFYETWDFYTTHLGFRTVCENDVYVHLVHPGGAQLGLLREELEGMPAELIGATNGHGFWLNVEVADADAEQLRLAREGVEIFEPAEDKPWGNRQLLVRDPNGVLIAIAHRIPIAVNSPAFLPAAS
ncbi:VOC family protein [Opitutus terrae]|uniref:Glyoxalase/bleomycin resistance protein/dioxygenase n=1 Tax=Opitutus terrae (strain DSM 11246 / JCM 15787 / PB90-1) TaxID=452637 RepID=B2A040_OPITP|nr:VOC family protein [Opitutus terrae]ACB77376.1 Glyoxalase/bleomycin resistance protein/dioxygenase [Opitutus terrae PB90-1]